MTGIRLYYKWHFLCLRISYRDVTDPKSPKFVGTYSSLRNRIVYTGDNSKKVIIKDASRKLKRGLIDKYKIDTICSVSYAQ
ncbi:hypothetical protein TELCIR_04516 [Teladorsagia circumcincta]|uniref:Uncharacterized protein n=1 Tax=Teladorsagia circumcincta TaxID=45464 RepID=A0A2G9UTC7_TELCI|nr:hypothetical protein TELCIR_04516 [Teladorsagia circumcincta]